MNMTGKTVLLTGFTSGVGEAAAWELAARGADLVLLCRNADKGRSVIQAIQEAHPNARLDLLVADLGSQAAIRKAAEEFNSLGRSLHVLFNNAGIFPDGDGSPVDTPHDIWPVSYTQLTLPTKA